MSFRVGVALIIGWLTVASATAQVVRFETTVGDFDMVLNPTNNPFLLSHADNMLQYVEDNRYSSSWINRADTGFVLQMGGFYSHTKRPPITIASTRPVATFDPVLGEPAATIDGLSNTVGTVSLALPGDGMGGTNQDAGTSSFFINLTSNAFLDEDFTVFAAIPDMTVVNRIMDLMTIDRTTDPAFGAGPGNLAFTDVPLMENGQQVFIRRAFVLQDTTAIARAMAGVAPVMALSSGDVGGIDSASATALLSGPAVVPEPSSAALLLLAGFTLAPRRFRCATAMSASRPGRGYLRSR
jgi:cyclophilin family peptidyl-prolyl cis-trans isomerase